MKDYLKRITHVHKQLLLPTMLLITPQTVGTQMPAGHRDSFINNNRFEVRAPAPIPPARLQRYAGVRHGRDIFMAPELP